MSKVEKFFFLLTIILIPVQLGKHFWPPLAFVEGIRLDYLSPTLYLSDISILFLFFLSVKEFFGRIKKVILKPVILVFVLLLFLSSILAKNPDSSFYYLLKIFEMFYLAFFVTIKLDKRIFKEMLGLLVLGSLVEVAISFFQFISKESLGGPFYFLGERAFSVSTIGIAKFDFLGDWILRPYGTFPHPNVLAYFLFFTFVLLLFFPVRERLFQILKIGVLAIIFTGIVLTFSRVVILFAVLANLFYFLKYFEKLKKYFIIFSFLYFVLLLFLLPRFVSDLTYDTLLRLSLFKIAIAEFFKHPILGVGLNNFFYYEIDYQKNITPVLLQPVHNIYAFWLAETGIFSFVYLLVFIKRTLQTQFEKAKSNTFNIAVSVLLVSSLIFGLFDHYLATLQQGQILFAILIGFSYSKIKV